MYKVIKTVNVKTDDYYLGIIYSEKDSFDGQLGNGININDPMTYQFSKTKFQQQVKEWGVKSFRVEVLREYDSLEEAQEYLNIKLTPKEVATKECLNNTYADKLYEVYVYDNTGKFANKKILVDADTAFNGLKLGKQYLSFLYDEKGFSKAKKMQIQNRPVFKYDVNGNFICSYETQVQAEKANKYSNITKSIKLKQPCRNGFYWTLQKLPKLYWKNRKWVQVYDSHYKYIRGYKFLKECQRAKGFEVRDVMNKNMLYDECYYFFK